MLLAVSFSCAFSGKAQVSYRGFVEGGIGFDYQTDDLFTNFSYSLATTHGIQHKNYFIGLGFGIIPGFAGNSDKVEISTIQLPLYANFRYDFFNLDMSLKPYIGIKAGYYLPISEFADSYGFPFYGALDFGFRKRISQSSGISFGLAIQTSSDGYYYDSAYYGLSSYSTFGLNILAKVGFDF